MALFVYNLSFTENFINQQYNILLKFDVKLHTSNITFGSILVYWSKVLTERFLNLYKALS